ncbi:MAG: hypothetical protein EZS28_040322, partial [Streblomastix strix]
MAVDNFSTNVLARIQPIPSTSGISLREYPIPSYESLRNACHHYELKNSGVVCHECRASRNLYDLSREIQDQLMPLLKEEQRKNHRIEVLAAAMHDWEEFFDTPPNRNPHSPAMTQYLAQLRAETSPVLSPKIIYEELKRLVALTDRQEAVIKAQAKYAEEEETQLQQEYRLLRERGRREIDTRIKAIREEVDEARRKDAQVMRQRVESIKDEYESVLQEKKKIYEQKEQDWQKEKDQWIEREKEKEKEIEREREWKM